MDAMKILLVSSELSPLVKTGGLADAAGALAQSVKQLGAEVSVAIPKYGQIELSGEPLCELTAGIGGETVRGFAERAEIPGTGIPLYLIGQPDYFNREGIYNHNGVDYADNLDRFVFFCQGVMELIRMDFSAPDLIHANDWQTALIPVYCKTTHVRIPRVRSIKTLYTIHNLGYQGLFPADEFPKTGLGWEHFHMEELEFYNRLNLMKGGITFADALNTVSPTYAGEIQTGDEFGHGLQGVLRRRSDKLSGILNGVDYNVWSPENDRHIEQRYTPETVVEGKAANKLALRRRMGLDESEPGRPLFGVITRLAHQKGVDLIAAIAPSLVERGAQFAFLGSGDPALKLQLEALRDRFRGRFAFEDAHDESLAHGIEAGADLFLMPSRYEPCGLNQMYSLRYGTIPVVHKTGGLADTIRDADEHAGGNGFVFSPFTPSAFLDACNRALARYRQEAFWLELMRRGMRQDFSWTVSAKRYLDLYSSILKSA